MQYSIYKDSDGEGLHPVEIWLVGIVIRKDRIKEDEGAGWKGKGRRRRFTTHIAPVFEHIIN